MANNQYPPAPPAPRPFPFATFQMPQGPLQPPGNNFGPQNNGPPLEQFMNMQLDSNAQRSRAGFAPGQFGQTVEVPTRFEGVTLRKDPMPPTGIEPSWSRVKETPMAASNDELIKTVNKRGKDNVQKDLKNLKSDKQRMQIDDLLEERRTLERHPNAEWVIVNVEEERGPGKRANETETKAIHVIMKRQQKAKPKSSIGGRKDSVNQTDIPGVVRDLNLPRRQSGGVQQVPPPPFARGPYQGPLQSLPGSMNPQSNHMGHLNGQNGGPNSQMSPPPPLPPPQMGPQMNAKMGQFPNSFPPPPPPVQMPQMPPNNQNQQNFPSPRPPIAIPRQGPPMQQSRPTNRQSQEDIIEIIGDDLQPKSKHGKNNYTGPPREKPKPIINNNRHSNVSFNTNSDDEGSSRHSRTSEDFTNITTPTSGSDSLPRGLERPKSSQQRRHSGIDYMADISERLSRDRRGSRSRRDSRNSDELLDDYVEIRPHSSTRKDRDKRERRGYTATRPFYGDRSVSDALYKPQRRLTPTEQLDQEYMLRLEQIRRNEDAKLDQRIRERDRYEREREERRYRSPPRHDRYYDRSPSRHDWRR